MNYQNNLINLQVSILFLKLWEARFWDKKNQFSQTNGVTCTKKWYFMANKILHRRGHYAVQSGHYLQQFERLFHV